MQKLKENKTFYVVMIVYTILTLVRAIFHQPWYDEAHAWTIAQQLNIVEIFKLMHLEGHTFIWYLLLMPFAKTNFFYPYPMLLLNWVFCWLAIFILWKKAPFNNLIKTLITFTFPFIGIYPILARCYSIGILGLFLLTALYKDRLNRPYLFSFLIILTANTSVMALIGASAFGLMLVYDLVKSYLNKTNEVHRKKLAITFTILLFGAILILLQLGNAPSSEYIKDRINVSNFFYFLTHIFNYSTVLSKILLVITLIATPVFLFKNKYAFTFWLYCSISLTAIFLFIYTAAMWHYYFFFVYFIISCWIFADNANGNIEINKKGLSIILGVISLCTIFHFDYMKVCYNSLPQTLAKSILQDKRVENSRIIFLKLYDMKLAPYFSKSNTELYNYCSQEPVSAKLASVYKTCRKGDAETLNFEEIKKTMALNKTNYLYMELSPEEPTRNGFVIEDNNEKILFKPIKCTRLYCLFEIQPKMD